jgi:hypothetical protein
MRSVTTRVMIFDGLQESEVGHHQSFVLGKVSDVVFWGLLFRA